MRATTRILAPFLLLALPVAVAGETPDPDVPGFDQRLFSVEGLSGPEAVHYDAEQDVWFVSNFNGEAAGDANGFVSRVSPDGEIESLRFMVGTEDAPLHGPRGMRIAGDLLWVADADGLHAFSRRSGEHRRFVDFRAFEPGFLNDVAIGPAGAIFVTDTGSGNVFRVADDSVSVFVDGERLQAPPNGIAWLPEAGRMVLAPWGGARRFEAFGLDEPSPAIHAELPAGGRMDGIEPWSGGLLIASQDDTAIWYWTPDGAEVLVRTPGRPADIGVDPERGRVAVPYIALDRVDVWALPDR